MAENFFARRGAAYINELRRSCGALMGIAQGILCDHHLADTEIHFLNEWLTQNDAIANEWPGDVLHYLAVERQQAVNCGRWARGREGRFQR
jgi:hypothetical protein